MKNTVEEIRLLSLKSYDRRTKLSRDSEMEARQPIRRELTFAALLVTS